MAAVDRDRDRSGRWKSDQRLGSQYLTLQFGANLKGSAARRFDPGRMAKRKEFRYQSHRAAIAARLPIFERMRSYSGVQRSGVISASGLTIRRGTPNFETMSEVQCRVTQPAGGIPPIPRVVTKFRA